MGTSPCQTPHLCIRDAEDGLRTLLPSLRTRLCRFCLRLGLFFAREEEGVREGPEERTKRSGTTASACLPNEEARAQDDGRGTFACMGSYALFPLVSPEPAEAFQASVGRLHSFAFLPDDFFPHAPACATQAFFQTPLPRVADATIPAGKTLTGHPVSPHGFVDREFRTHGSCFESFSSVDQFT